MAFREICDDYELDLAEFLETDELLMLDPSCWFEPSDLFDDGE